MESQLSSVFKLPSGENLDDDLGPTAIASSMAVAALAGLALVARLLSRRIQKTTFCASDALVILGLLCSWAVSGILVYGKYLLLRISKVSADTKACRCKARSWPTSFGNCYRRSFTVQAIPESSGS